MQEFELYHHGIKGQRWGQRNGPPYPLSKRVARAVKRGAKATASGVKTTYRAGLKAYDTVEGVNEDIRHRRMMKIIKRGKFKEILKHVDDFNDEELKAAKDRLALQKAIRDIKYADKETGKNLLDKSVELLKTVGGGFTAVNSILQSKDSIAARKEGKITPLDKATAASYYEQLRNQADSIVNNASTSGSFAKKDVDELRNLAEAMSKIKALL